MAQGFLAIHIQHSIEHEKRLLQSLLSDLLCAMPTEQIKYSIKMTLFNFHFITAQLEIKRDKWAIIHPDVSDIVSYYLMVVATTQ